MGRLAGVLGALVALALAPPELAHAGEGSAPELARVPLGPAHLPIPPMWNARIHLSSEASLTLREVWEPVSLAPDAYFGLPYDAAVGIYHSRRAAGLLDSGGGLCLRGHEAGCVDRYSGIGVHGILPLHSWDHIRLATTLRIDSTRFSSPAKPRAIPGASVEIEWRRLAVLAELMVAVGLINRAEGNESRVIMPVWLQVRIAGPIDAFFRTGLNAPFTGFADSYQIPIGLGIGARVHSRVRVEVQAAFPRILGPLNTERPRDLLVHVVGLL